MSTSTPEEARASLLKPSLSAVGSKQPSYGALSASQANPNMLAGGRTSVFQRAGADEAKQLPVTKVPIQTIPTSNASLADTTSIISSPSASQYSQSRPSALLTQVSSFKNQDGIAVSILISSTLWLVLSFWAGFLGYLFGTAASIFNAICCMQFYQVTHSSRIHSFSRSWRRNSRIAWIVSSLIVSLLLAARLMCCWHFHSSQEFPQEKCYKNLGGSEPFDCLRIISSEKPSSIPEVHAHNLKAPAIRAHFESVQMLLRDWINQDIFQSRIDVSRPGFLHATAVTAFWGLINDIYAKIECLPSGEAIVSIHIEQRVGNVTPGLQISWAHKLLARLQRFHEASSKLVKKENISCLPP